MEFKAVAKNIADKITGSIRTGFKRVVFVFPILVLAAAILGSVFSGIRIVQIKSDQNTQTAAGRWAGDSGKRYRQVSLFAQGQTQQSGAPPLYIDPERSINLETLAVIRESLNTTVESSAAETDKAQKKGKKNQEKPETSQLWTDAFSSEAKAQLSSIRDDVISETSIETSVTGVSGNYILFHPMEMLSGSFLNPEVIDSQDIVINEQLAWNMFKSSEVTGQKIVIASRVYIIVGVVREPDSKSDLLAGSDKARAYIYFEELAYLLPGGSSETNFTVTEDSSGPVADSDSLTQDDLAIMCYEAVLPDQILGIAENDLKSSVASYSDSTKNFLIISNTGRFGLFRLAGDLFPVGGNTAVISRFTYPTSELSAQIAESMLVFWWTILLFSILLIPLTILSVYLTVRRYSRIRRV